MFRLWCKLFDESNHLVKDTVIENADYSINRTKKIFDGIKDACYEFDLGKPIWLDATIHEFKVHDKARFYQDNFIEHIDFDFLEIQVIEE